MFWKCVQRKCDLFEWIDEQDQADIEEAKTAASSLNPRRSKSPRQASLAVVNLTAPSQSWSRVSQTSHVGPETILIEDDEGL